MKNFKQFITDLCADEDLKKKFNEKMNNLRADESLTVMEAGIRTAHEFGYEISEAEVRALTDYLQDKSTQGRMPLSDDELDNAAGGSQLNDMLNGMVDDIAEALNKFWELVKFFSKK